MIINKIQESYVQLYTVLYPVLYTVLYPYSLFYGWKNLFIFFKDFYSHLNIEDITDADYALTKRVCKDFEIKNVGGYQDLHVKSDTLLLADIFENFQIMCLEIISACKTSFSSWISMAISFNPYSTMTENFIEIHIFGRF